MRLASLWQNRELLECKTMMNRRMKRKHTMRKSKRKTHPKMTEREAPVHIKALNKHKCRIKYTKSTLHLAQIESKRHVFTKPEFDARRKHIYPQANTHVRKYNQKKIRQPRKKGISSKKVKCKKKDTESKGAGESWRRRKAGKYAEKKYNRAKENQKKGNGSLKVLVHFISFGVCVCSFIAYTSLFPSPCQLVHSYSGRSCACV